MAHSNKVQFIKAAQNPQTMIGIALDTAYLTSLAPGTIPNTGIYMCDNRLNVGSRSEGQIELSTFCYPGDNISFCVQPIDSQRGDTVKILGITVSQGNLFGGSLGTPKPANDDHTYWIGRIINGGTQTYTLQVLITDESGDFYVITWDPYVTTVR
jgi:hypothetical protein